MEKWKLEKETVEAEYERVKEFLVDAQDSDYFRNLQGEAKALRKMLKSGKVS